MKLNVLRADPAGNITAFVLNEVPRERHGEIAKAILSIGALKAEQVAFRCRGAGGERNRIEMSGGEFCGNASRAFGMLLAKERGLRGQCRVEIEISGCKTPVSVEVEPDAQTASAEMPLPVYVGKRTVDGAAGTLVRFEGIALLVAEVEPDQSFFDRAESIFDEFPALEAYGVVFLAKDGKMTPLIKVPAAGSLVWEGSCGSGSLACAIAESEGTEGEFTKDYIQPAGTIRASVFRAEGRLIRARIGGGVRLDEPQVVEIPDKSE